MSKIREMWDISKAFDEFKSECVLVPKKLLQRKDFNSLDHQVYLFLAGFKKGFLGTDEVIFLKISNDKVISKNEIIKKTKLISRSVKKLSLSYFLGVKKEKNGLTFYKTLLGDDLRSFDSVLYEKIEQNKDSLARIKHIALKLNFMKLYHESIKDWHTESIELFAKHKFENLNDEYFYYFEDMLYVDFEDFQQDYIRIKNRL